MLTTDIETLFAQANAIETGSARIDYRTRLSVERAIFRTAKALASRCLLLDLSGFSGSARSQVMEALQRHPVQPSVRFCLDLAFELTAALGSLASGDAYVRKELMLEAVPGRLGAIRLFGRRLRAYAIELARVSCAERTA